MKFAKLDRNKEVLKRLSRADMGVFGYYPVFLNSFTFILRYLILHYPKILLVIIWATQFENNITNLMLIKTK